MDLSSDDNLRGPGTTTMKGKLIARRFHNTRLLLFGIAGNRHYSRSILEPCRSSHPLLPSFTQMMSG